MSDKMVLCFLILITFALWAALFEVIGHWFERLRESGKDKDKDKEVEDNGHIQ